MQVVSDAKEGLIVGVRVTDAPADARAVYKRRSQICEFPNLYLKESARLRRFHVTGLRKARTEVLWVALTFNLVRALALRKRRKEGQAAA